MSEEADILRSVPAVVEVLFLGGTGSHSNGDDSRVNGLIMCVKEYCKRNQKNQTSRRQPPAEQPDLWCADPVPASAPGAGRGVGTPSCQAPANCLRLNHATALPDRSEIDR